MDQSAQLKKGKKWLWVVGVVLFIILVGALSSKKPSEGSRVTAPQASQPNPTAVPKTYKEIYSSKGKGNSNGEAFTTSGGKLKVTARTWGSTVGSYSAIDLKSENGSFLANAGLNITTEGSKEGTGETIIRDAKAGSYFVSVISGINWEVHVYEEK